MRRCNKDPIRETVQVDCVDNIDTDQPVYPHSLIEIYSYYIWLTRNTILPYSVSGG